MKKTICLSASVQTATGRYIFSNSTERRMQTPANINSRMNTNDVDKNPRRRDFGCGNDQTAGKMIYQ
jgi:hypothetical protein